MKTASIAIFTVVVAFPVMAFAQGGAVDVPQVPRNAVSSAGTTNESLPITTNEEHKKDYQSEILNNPTISEFGRANSMLNLTTSSSGSPTEKEKISDKPAATLEGKSNNLKTKKKKDSEKKKKKPGIKSSPKKED